MSPALEDVVGSAIIDRDFRAGLLNGTRARLLSQFDLSPEEHQALMNIRAESLESFARQLYSWVESQRSKRPAYLMA